MFAARDRDRLTAQLAAAQARIGELEAEVSRLSSRDPICVELLTRHAFMAQFELDVQRAQRYSRPLAVALIDVDRFRNLNLKHGYGAGDLVLGGVGAAIVSCSRTHDMACRVGGDEFAVLFPETEAEGAVDAVERILASLSDLDAGGLRGHSASAGIAVLEPSHTPETLLAAAGSALEGARAAGGAQLMVYSGSPDEPGRAGREAGLHGESIAALAATLGERERPGDEVPPVVEICAGVAAAMAMPDDRIARLRTAALLHEIGKVGIPEDILHKPGPLNDSEWELMRQHPVIAERIIRAMPGMSAIAEAVRHEHERWDGNGYPDGLAGEAIPLESRIVLACNAYCAMTTDRPYREALPHSEAIAELNAHAGAQFDPRVVECLTEQLDRRTESGLATV